MKETVAVIMTAYNEKEEWIRASIESVLQQTYQKLRFYILLDHPHNERLRDVIAEYAKEDQRICWRVNRENLGLVGSLNQLLSVVTEPYIARMDADDICLPGRLEQEMSFLLQHQLDFVMSGIDFIREDCILPGPDVPCLLPGVFAEAEKYGNFATHPTWLVKREVYEKLQGYRNITYCEDLDFVLRSLQNGFKLGRMEEVLLHYRLRESGISMSYAYEQFEKADLLRRAYAKNHPVEQLNPDEINALSDCDGAERKQEFIRQKQAVDDFTGCLYAKRYGKCLLLAAKGIVTSQMYRRIFFYTLRNYLQTRKLFKEVGAI